ncbi:acetylxylan esterase [Pedobacter sp. Leaf132]|uniref:acetylxylan esterase n=1 Tax=Pedobacter sp. Leaf132 TaxID=2876557 RepID=UPI001E337448|nr:acetylxylan esterase [Pedobacter sp. Leaf132]
MRKIEKSPRNAVISTEVEKSFKLVTKIARLSLATTTVVYAPFIATSSLRGGTTKQSNFFIEIASLDEKSNLAMTIGRSSLPDKARSGFSGKQSLLKYKNVINFFLLFLSLFFCAFTSLYAQTQNSDKLYKKPLTDVLKEIQMRFKVQIKYSEPQVKDKWVNYAEWRFRADVDETLANVLAPLDMKVNKEKPGVYKLKEYEYYRWEVQDGWNYLDSLATKYSDKNSWEKRKEEIKPELYKALLLSPLPEKPNSKPIVTAKRIFDGYSVENIALEILPGVWINGSLYKPLKAKGKIPVILSPDGHWEKQRYRADCQLRCATIARMGAMAFSYDLFAWGESMLQFKYEDHRKSLAQTIQTLGGIRILDYFSSLKETDTNRIGISGGSGAGSHSILMTAMDDRIKLSAPVVAMSSYFYGGCPCESGMPIHQCAGGTDNVELAAMAAPRPQLLVSDGGDWTAHTPEHDFPYLQKMYGYYGVKNKVENVHLPTEKHDFGINKRIALYDFLIKNFKLNASAVKDKMGKYDESKVTIERENALYVFGDNGEKLPKNAVMGFENLEKLFPSNTTK